MTIERASPVLAHFDQNAFEFGHEQGMRTALRSNQDSIRTNYIADISAFRRRLFIGGETAVWLAANGVENSLGLLESAELDDGAYLVRLHRDQYLLIDGAQAGVSQRLFDYDEGRHDDILIMNYDAAEFACGGPYVGDLVAELCPADVASMPAGSWTSTRIAHCEAALRRLDSPLHYRIVCSNADARFLFGVLGEITLSRDGVMLGTEDYRTWLKRGD